MTLYGHLGKMDIKIYIKKTEMIRMKKGENNKCNEEDE